MCSQKIRQGLAHLGFFQDPKDLLLGVCFSCRVCFLLPHLSLTLATPASGGQVNHGFLFLPGLRDARFAFLFALRLTARRHGWFSQS